GSRRNARHHASAETRPVPGSRRAGGGARCTNDVEFCDMAKPHAVPPPSPAPAASGSDGPCATDAAGGGGERGADTRTDVADGPAGRSSTQPPLRLIGIAGSPADHPTRGLRVRASVLGAGSVSCSHWG